MIKFFDIFKNDKILHSRIINDIKKTFKKGDFIQGEHTKSFEKNFSKFVNAKYSVGCANGTDALILALKSLELPINSEVILPSMTYCSTIFAVIQSNLKPVLVDIGLNSPTIDINKINRNITKKTKVILPVHLYGSAINIDLIKKILKKHKQKIFIIDDCAQAHGALDDKKKNIGSTSDISCFSLYPGKNLGAYGDAGIITTNNINHYKKIKNLGNLGSDQKFIHTNVGLNSRLDSIQAIILNAKLTKLNSSNKKRRIIANTYDKYINNKKIIKLSYSKYAVYHQYVIKSKNRSKLIKILKKKNIQYGFHYPFSINQLHAVRKIFKKKKFRNSEILAAQGISLPIDPNLKKKQINKIIQVVNNF
ncbi:DegT/DnrJ/EryC1/StrS family aminotransferase [Pelagibacterales bacterium SAG-MED39]|nr:DegT/DnrJ/EryC1/StrS family aminotransferase [Pelagibacterales bacterium SAG-MED39]